MRHVSLGPVPDFAGMPGWRTTGYGEAVRGDGRRVICIEAEAAEEPAPLHYCDKPTIRPNGRPPITIFDVPRGDMPVQVIYRRRRWRCFHCGDVNILEEPVGLVPGHRLTKRLFEHIVRLAQPNTFREVARRVGLVEGSIRNVFASARRAHEARPIQAPLAIGVDEKYLFGKARGTVSDIGRHKLLTILDDNTRSMRAFLSELTDKDRTRVFTTDMAGGYEKMAREIFPRARVVIDRFHVIQPMGKALEKYRLRLADEEEKRLGLSRSKLRDHNGVLLARWYKAKPRHRAFLERLFERYPALYEAYQVKEDFASIYDMAMGISEAEDMFDSWFALIPEHLREWFDPAMFSKQWRPFILAYFDEPYTNGFVEGINAIIGDRWRAGRGYSLDVLRFKMVIDVSTIALPDGLGDLGWREEPDDDTPDDWDDAAEGRRHTPPIVAQMYAILEQVGLFNLLREVIFTDDGDDDLSDVGSLILPSAEDPEDG